MADVAAIWQRDWHFAPTVFVAIAVAMTVAAGLGAVIPQVLRRLRTNPTVAAGPVLLALADFISLIVYFRVGTALL